MKSNFHIRQANVKDIESINLISEQIHLVHKTNSPDVFSEISYEFSKEEITKINNSNSEFLYVALVVDEVVGYIFFEKKVRSENIFMEKEEIIKVKNLGILKEYRGQGIGTALLELPKEKAREFKIKRILLTVWSFNDEAVKMYKKNGLEEVKKEMELILKKD